MSDVEVPFTEARRMLSTIILKVLLALPDRDMPDPTTV